MPVRSPLVEQSISSSLAHQREGLFSLLWFLSRCLGGVQRAAQFLSRSWEYPWAIYSIRYMIFAELLSHYGTIVTARRSRHVQRSRSISQSFDRDTGAQAGSCVV